MLHSYTFNQMGSLKADAPDQTQQNVQNTRFGNYSVANYFSNTTSDNQVKFASQYLGFVPSNLGISSAAVDIESQLFNKIESERSDEKLQLFARPFLTVPYLGRGGGNPTLESQLQQGQIVRDLRSVSTVTENPYIDYQTYPMRDDLKKQIGNPANSVEELAMDGWRRGGVSARENQ
jgi:PPE-repeat protein